MAGTSKFFEASNLYLELSLELGGFDSPEFLDVIDTVKDDIESDFNSLPSLPNYDPTTPGATPDIASRAMGGGELGGATSEPPPRS